MGSFKKIRKKVDSSVTKNDIIDIAGPLDDRAVKAILQMDATLEEVLHAFSRLEEDHYTQSIQPPPVDERIREIYDILSYADANFGSYGHHRH